MLKLLLAQKPVESAEMAHTQLPSPVLFVLTDGRANLGLLDHFFGRGKEAKALYNVNDSLGDYVSALLHCIALTVLILGLVAHCSAASGHSIMRSTRAMSSWPSTCWKSR